MTLRIAVLLCAVLTACEKPTHSNIEKWRTTVKGPGKLASAFKDAGLDPDLRAHAAQALISLDKGAEILGALGKMDAGERAPVVEKLAPRLWTDCKLSDELQAPSRKQILAKDAMFELRAMASPKVQEEIDGYLIDWFTGYYEGRNAQGVHQGDEVVRTVGPKFTAKLMAQVKAIMADKGDDKTVRKVDDSLLLGIAWSGSPEGVEFLLRLADKPQGIDEQLPSPEQLRVRALGALYVVFVTDQNRLKNAKLLAPHTGLLQAIAASDEQPGENVNVAYDLIAVVGKPECIAPMKVLASTTKDWPRRWRAVQYGLKCGGPDAVKDMAEALPQDTEYEQGIIEKYFWDKIVELGPGAAVPARKLLDSPSWVARLTGVEVLQRLGTKADAGAVRKLEKDGTKVKGWWGKDPKEKKKPEPTVGALASTAANKLEMK